MAARLTAGSPPPPKKDKPMRLKQTGVTLIELVIVVSIILILSAIAVPSYQKHMQRSNRSDAMSALMRVAAEQEKFYFANSRYATFAELGSPTTQRGWYTIAIPTADADTFEATATASGPPQINDTACQTFQLTASGVRTAEDGDNNPNNICWR